MNVNRCHNHVLEVRLSRELTTQIDLKGNPCYSVNNLIILTPLRVYVGHEDVLLRTYHHPWSPYYELM